VQGSRWALGFTLREIRAVLAMSDHTMKVTSKRMCELAEAKLAELAELAEAKLAELADRRAHLRKLERGIATLLRRLYDATRPCPILLSLGG